MRRARRRRAARRWGSRSRRTRPGNLLARVRGRGERTILLCAHLDTVPPVAPIEPVLVDDGWENANDGILGADNKSAVAMILEVARRCSVEGSPVGLELLFTVAEEVGLQGAKRFDASQLRSEFGYVFDHATPIGEVVTASPTLYRIEAEFHGKSAHAGLRPETGRSAILAAAHAAVGDAARPHRRADDRQPRLPARRRRVHQRRPRARPPARRGPLGRPRPRRGGARRDDRRAARRREPRRVRRRRDHREAGHRLPPTPVVAGRRGRRGGAARPRLRAAADRHRRRVGRERASRPRASRASTSPTAPSTTTSRPSASRSPRWSRCSTSRSPCSTRRRWHERPNFETHRLRDDLRRQVPRRPPRPLPPRGRRGGRARPRRPPRRRRRRRARRRRQPVARPPAARGRRRPGPARDPGRQARRGGRGPARGRPSASWPRRSASRPTQWESLGSFYTSPGFADEEIHLFLATGHLGRRERPEVEEDERIDVEVRPLADLDAILAETRTRRR